MKQSKSFYSQQWNTGQGAIISFRDIEADICLHSKSGGRIYIGADSQIHGSDCTFVTAICLHGGNNKTSRYYFKRESRRKYKNTTLRNRISDEVSEALEVFLHLTELAANLDIEIHIDIGNTERSKTRSFVDSITGWVKGFGVPCKIKPEAWASASVADRHTK